MMRARSLALVAALLAPVAVCALLSLTRGLITNNNAALVPSSWWSPLRRPGTASRGWSRPW